MHVLSIEFGLHTPRKCLHLCIHLQGAGMKMSTSRGSVSLIACSATCCCSASSMCVASDDLQASQAKVDSTCDKHHLSCVNEKGVAHGCGASQMPTRRRYRADTLAKIAVSIAELMSVPPDVPRGWWKPGRSSSMNGVTHHRLMSSGCAPKNPVIPVTSGHAL